MQCMRTEGKKMASAQPTGNKLLSLILLSFFFSFCFVNILQQWLGYFARLLKVQFTSNEGMSNDVPIHECESEIDHYAGPHVPYSLRIITLARCCETGATVYRPYLRRLESQTVYRCYYKGSTSSSVI